MLIILSKVSSSLDRAVPRTALLDCQGAKHRAELVHRSQVRCLPRRWNSPIVELAITKVIFSRVLPHDSVLRVKVCELVS